jgi:hypothetical protein
MFHSRFSALVPRVSLLTIAFCGVLAFDAYADQGCPPGFTPNAAGTPGMQCIPIGGQYHGDGAGDFAPPTEQWAVRWGAIAVDNASGKTGILGNMSSRRKAEKGAMAQCQQKGGAACEVKLTYYNQCGVLAWGNGKMVTASGPTLAEAGELALTECARSANAQCEVFFSDCSYAQRVR